MEQTIAKYMNQNESRIKEDIMTNGSHIADLNHDYRNEIHTVEFVMLPNNDYIEYDTVDVQEF